MEDGQYKRGKLTKKLCDEIKDMILENELCYIKAPTSCGKSTTIPMHLYYTLPENMKIFVVQPTVVSVKSTISGIMFRKPEIPVGKGAESDNTYNSETRLVIATAGHFVRKMLGYFKDDKLVSDMDFCDIILLDEAHQGSIDYEMIMGIWALAYRYSDEFSIPKLALMSATLNMKITPFIDDIPNIIIPEDGRQFSIDFRYYNKNFKIEDNNLYIETAKEIKRLHSEYRVEQDQITRWLVFVPGKSEAKKIELELMGVDNMRVFVLMGETQNEIMPILNETGPPGIRYVIISSNVAESSVTIDMIDGVFDTLVEKLDISGETGESALTSVNVGKSSSQQRCGRTGRQLNGFCLRMCTEDFYNSVLRDHRPGELHTSNLSSAFLTLSRYGIHPKTIFGRRLSNQRLHLFFDLLIKLGMIEKDENGLYKTTRKGIFAASFKISPRNAAILWEWLLLCKNKGFEFFPIIIFVSVIETLKGTPFFFPRKEKGEDKNSYERNKINLFHKFVDNLGLENISDPVPMYLEIYEKIVSNYNSIRPPRSELNKFCSKYDLNAKNIDDLLKCVKDIYSTMSSNSFYKNHGISVKPVVFNIEEFMIILRKRIINKVYPDKIYEKIKNNYITTEGEAAKIDTRAHYIPGFKASNKLVALSEKMISRVERAHDERTVTLFLNL